MNGAPCPPRPEAQELVNYFRDLGPGWRDLNDPSRGTILLVHGSGLWVELHADPEWWGPGEWEALAKALRIGVQRGYRGEHYATMYRYTYLDGRKVQPWEVPDGGVAIDVITAQLEPMEAWWA